MYDFINPADDASLRFKNNSPHYADKISKLKKIFERLQKVTFQRLVSKLNSATQLL